MWPWSGFLVFLILATKVVNIFETTKENGKNSAWNLFQHHSYNVFYNDIYLHRVIFDSVTVDSWQFPRSKKIAMLTESLQFLFGNKYKIIYINIYINIYIYLYIKIWLGFSIFGLSKLSTVNCNAVTPFFAFHWKMSFWLFFLQRLPSYPWSYHNFKPNKRIALRLSALYSTIYDNRQDWCSKKWAL